MSHLTPDIVHYVTKYGKHRPAVIVDRHDEPGDPAAGTFDLQVFTAAHNDPPGSFRDGCMQGAGTAFVQQATQDEEEKAPYTFHFPERV